MTAPPEYYDQGIKKNIFQKIWHKPRFNFLRKILPQVNGKVLDVGCHSGTLTEEMSKLLPQVKIWAMDINQKAVEYAQEKRPAIDFQVASAEKIPFKDKNFDLITCFEVLEHLAKPEKALKEIKRCLKKDGQVVILVPNENFLFKTIWFFWTKGKGKVWQKAHLQHFHFSELEKLMIKVGFQPELKASSHFGMLIAIRARIK